jgi:hypothetical protein
MSFSLRLLPARGMAFSDAVLRELAGCVPLQSSGNWLLVFALDRKWSVAMSKVKVGENPCCSVSCKKETRCGCARSIALFTTRNMDRVFSFFSMMRAQRLFSSGSVTGDGMALFFPQWSGRAMQAGKITECGPRRQVAVALLARSGRKFMMLCKTRAACPSFWRADVTRFLASADLRMARTKLRCPKAARKG